MKSSVDSLDAELQRNVQQLLKRARELEHSDIHAENLKSLGPSIQPLFESKNPFVMGICKVYSQLISKSKPISPREFFNFFVPIERALNMMIADDDFLISSKDRPSIESNANKVNHLPCIPCSSQPSLVFILDHLRSAFNVGNIFRLADAIGSVHIDLIGYSPTPEHSKLKRSALGSDATIKWTHYEYLKDSLDYWKSQNFSIVALETAEPSTPVFSARLLGRTAFLVGNERFGLLKSDLPLCDQVIHVPMHGIKNSLNVGNCLSVVGYEWFRQNSK